jgi:hypothetical protein
MKKNHIECKLKFGVLLYTIIKCKYILVLISKDGNSHGFMMENILLSGNQNIIRKRIP